MSCLSNNYPINPLSPFQFTEQNISINRCDRWQISRRLQELDIPCTCPDDGSLRVQVDTPLALIQLWSVVSPFTMSRRELGRRLNRCLNLKP